MDSLEFKLELLALSRRALAERMAMLSKAMREAQAEANSHVGAMESRYDTFKEEAQALRNGYARQIAAGEQDAALLQQITPKPCATVQLGALVHTRETQDGEECEIDYFISCAVVDDPVPLEGRSFRLIRPSAPLAQAMLGLRPGQAAMVGDRHIEICSVQ